MSEIHPREPNTQHSHSQLQHTLPYSEGSPESNPYNQPGFVLANLDFDNNGVYDDWEENFYNTKFEKSGDIDKDAEALRDLEALADKNGDGASEAEINSVFKLIDDGDGKLSAEEIAEAKEFSTRNGSDIGLSTIERLSLPSYLSVTRSSKNLTDAPNS